MWQCFEQIVRPVLQAGEGGIVKSQGFENI
jgi:hypothetical protein